jgi:hypothetical protein
LRRPAYLPPHQRLYLSYTCISSKLRRGNALTSITSGK